MDEKRKIIALTTDPYDAIYGYSLVFVKLFDFLQKNNKDVNIILISNDGVCSKLVNNEHFQKIKLNPQKNFLFKTTLLVYFFIKKVKNQNRNAIFANLLIGHRLQS